MPPFKETGGMQLTIGRFNTQEIASPCIPDGCGGIGSLSRHLLLSTEQDGGKRTLPSVADITIRIYDDNHIELTALVPAMLLFGPRIKASIPLIVPWATAIKMLPEHSTKGLSKTDMKCIFWNEWLDMIAQHVSLELPHLDEKGLSCDLIVVMNDNIVSVECLGNEIGRILAPYCPDTKPGEQSLS